MKKNKKEKTSEKLTIYNDNSSLNFYTYYHGMDKMGCFFGNKINYKKDKVRPWYKVYLVIDNNVYLYRTDEITDDCVNFYTINNSDYIKKSFPLVRIITINNSYINFSILHAELEQGVYILEENTKYHPIKLESENIEDCFEEYIEKFLEYEKSKNKKSYKIYRKTDEDEFKEIESELSEIIEEIK